MSDRTLRGRWTFLTPGQARCQNDSCRRVPETEPEEGGWIQFIHEWDPGMNTYWCPRCITKYRSMVEIENDGD